MKKNILFLILIFSCSFSFSEELEFSKLSPTELECYNIDSDETLLKIQSANEEDLKNSENTKEISELNLNKTN